jgi:hypothetical protein
LAQIGELAILIGLPEPTPARILELSDQALRTVARDILLIRFGDGVAFGT